ncbi:MAG: hypothetical protein EOP83_00065 [Verrucomicrobiaceae bacterium]|nr:MAG: hypothetical protein EOP83_00065 [Verrucomicrobiaceae bacterium]
MKTPASLLLIAAVGTLAFFAGNRSAGGNGGSDEVAAVPDNPATSSKRSSSAERNAAKRERTRIVTDELTIDDAQKLTPEERKALLNKAALLSDPNKQAKILCGLIAAMSKDELKETTQTLMQIQHRGNEWSQAVWNELWTQWGRTDPQGCLELSAEGDGLVTGEDYRRMMSGWLDTDAASALAWANRPGLNERESVAAAFAISSDAGSDLGRLQSAIMAIPDNPGVARTALHDYFDLAIASGEDADLSAIYAQMDPTLQQTAWPVMVQRLSYTDPEQAIAWLKEHATDPGRDYRSLGNSFHRMAMADPAGMASWAALLPVAQKGDPDANTPHPAVIAAHNWLRRDTAAATAWLETQPVGTPWRALIERRANGE